MLIELFSLGVTDEVLQAKIDRKLAISVQLCQFFSGGRGRHHQSFFHAELGR